MQLRLDDALLPLLQPTSDYTPLTVRPPDRREVSGHKGSIFYRAHSYHTKVPPEGIAPIIEHYTDPGDFVLDPFCGSGMTGVACLMTGRRGLLSDLSPAAVHIASNYTSQIDPEGFSEVARGVLTRLDEVERSLYGTACPSCRQPARVEFSVWSDVFGCAGCGTDIVFWAGGLDADGNVASRIVCAHCHREWAKRELGWRKSVPVLQSISCTRCRGRHERTLSPAEQAAWLALDRSAVKEWYPTVQFEAGREMWRGQHREQAIDTAADFFTTRNLWALATVWEQIGRIANADVQPALRFWFTSAVNRASRRYQWNPKRPTNVLSSTMYVASLSYEFNVFSLLRRKARALTDLYKTTAGLPGRVEVVKQPAQTLGNIPDHSVHYVFTDPPFGSNIFYADSSFLWEAWLGDSTDMTREAVVNKSVRPSEGGKSLTDYEKLMTGAFEEINRVLRLNGWASVMFHNSDDQVWSALERSIEGVGFEVGAAVAFDKRQPSFKGIKGLTAGERVPSFDLVLHLTRRSTPRSEAHTRPTDDVWTVIEQRLRQHVGSAQQHRRTTPFLHSLVMRILLEEGWALRGFTYRAVEELCQRLFVWDGKAWSLHPEDPRPSESEPKP